MATAGACDRFVRSASRFFQPSHEHGNKSRGGLSKRWSGSVEAAGRRPAARARAAAVDFAALEGFAACGRLGSLRTLIGVRLLAAKDCWEKVDEIPFDFSRRVMSVVVAAPGGGRLLVCMGASSNFGNMLSVLGQACSCRSCR